MKLSDIIAIAGENSDLLLISALLVILSREKADDRLLLALVMLLI